MKPTVPIPSHIAEILNDSTINGCNLTLPATLDRTTYVAVDKILKILGGKWDKRAKAHVFPAPPDNAIEEALRTGVVTNTQQLYGQFFTPPDLARYVVSLIDVAGHTVLEPSAGGGALIEACLDAGAATVDAVEIQQPLYEDLQVLAKKRLCRSNAQGIVANILCIDFLSIMPMGPYQRIVMNPPFALRADIKHVTHALKFLAPGGKLAAIMSAGVLFRSDKLTADFCRKVEGLDGRFIDLPEGSFRSSGTGVNTTLLLID